MGGGVYIASTQNLTVTHKSTNSVGLIAHIGGTETLQRETKRLQSHLGVTDIPIDETDLPRVCGSGYDI